MSSVVISHGHLDHLGGLGYWASQRFLHAMGPARLFVPAPIAADVRALLELFSRLEGGRPYDIETTVVDENDTWELRADIDLNFFPTDHWVPTLGVQLTWKKHRLRAELASLTSEEIASLAQAGEPVSTIQAIPLLAYFGDTGPRVFSQQPDLFEAEVLILECSFFNSEDRNRARRFGHLHIEDLLEVAGKLRCRHLVLAHASRRNRLREIEELLHSRLLPEIGCSLHHLNIDWE